MASAIIHLAVAKRVNEVLKQEENAFYLGAIAPDISKMVGSTRARSHFITDDGDIPDKGYFLSKYKSQLVNPFELGYYVHLLTDILWFGEFLKNYVNDCTVTDKEGRCFTLDHDELVNMIYNDYSNMNSKVVDYYGLDFSLFYQDYKFPESHIEELPSEYFPDLIDKMQKICCFNSHFSYFFDIENITHFVEYASVYVLDELKKVYL